jgi:glycosyltransferase involved in cell wall biosynthesis
VARNPSFSIIVPTYQRREVVCDTLRALCRIDYDGAVEIIVVVDGSTDGTAEAVAKVECPFPLRVIEQDNRGLAAARNRGAAEAGHDVLLFLDDDMICEPDLLSRHAQSYAAGADAVIGRFTEPADPFAGFSTLSVAGATSRAGDEPVRSPFGLYGGHMSVRRSAFEQAGGFDESFTADGAYGYEDSDIAYRLLQHFAVHRNHGAVCQHLKRISPREYIGRARRSARAELRLLAKHPELGGELNEWAGALRISKRLRLLARVPIVPRVLVSAATWVAEAAMRTPLRSSRKLTRLCNLAYTVNYWSSVQRTRGIPRV